MKVDGLKGCFEKTRGVFYFARMCSKIRLHAQGKLPKDYHEGLGEGFDGRTCRYLRVRYEDVRAQVLSGKPTRKFSTGALPMVGGSRRRAF